MTGETSQPPKYENNHYNERIRGVFGRFGAGMDIRVCFVQAALAANDLSKIQLVSEIPGSDRWPVRDLFQRDVDTKRVETSILPWLQDESKVKFFNPLTLTLVPIDPVSNHILSEVPSLTESTVKDDTGTWACLERNGFYRFKFIANNGIECREYGLIEWNSANVRLVAIDGQHRLSALKRYLHDEGGPGFNSFVDWNIPVVISGLDSNDSVDASILDVVRNMFVYINTQARTPCQSRQILLNDEDINYICVQELLEYSHENDCLEDLSSRDQSRIPLMFYDWRGETENGRERPSPASMKSVTELSDWFRHYILGDNFDESQQFGLGIDESHVLRVLFEQKQLHGSIVSKLRMQFRDWVLPGFAYLLENFQPYNRYIQRVLRAERKWQQQGDIHRHALAKLRFGAHRGGESIQEGLGEVYDDIIHELIDYKQDIPSLLRYDIGMRGVVYAFGTLKEWHDEWTASQALEPWLPYSKWFTKHLNRAYREEWFEAASNSLRLNITHNAAGNIINHKISDAHKALGALVATVVCHNAWLSEDAITDESQWDEAWSSFSLGTLRATLKAGYKKQHTAEFKTSHPQWSPGKLKEEVTKKAERSADDHIKRLAKTLSR
jgi:hypothetical protein